jgi:hypothetical protein
VPRAHPLLTLQRRPQVTRRTNLVSSQLCRPPSATQRAPHHIRPGVRISASRASFAGGVHRPEAAIPRTRYQRRRAYSNGRRKVIATRSTPTPPGHKKAGTRETRFMMRPRVSKKHNGYHASIRGEKMTQKRGHFSRATLRCSPTPRAASHTTTTPPPRVRTNRTISRESPLPTSHRKQRWSI